MTTKRLLSIAAALSAILTVSLAEDGDSLRLAVDDHLTTWPVVSHEGRGRCVALRGLVAGLEANADARFALDGSEAALTLSAEDALFDRDGEQFVRLGYLCLKQGFRIEVNEEHGYLRVLTPGERKTQEEFLQAWLPTFQSEALLAQARSRAFACGPIAVDDEILRNVFSLRACGRTFVPLLRMQECLEDEGASTFVGTLDADNKRGLLRHRGFEFDASQPMAFTHRGETYVEDTFLAEKAGLRLDRAEDCGGVRFRGGQTALPVDAVFASGRDLDRALKGARRAQRNLFKVAYLTFDDGPSRHVTPMILDVLAEYDVRATFFVLGKEAKIRPEILKRTSDEGHTIANHTFTHIRKKLYPNFDNFRGEIRQTNDLFEEVLGRRTRMIRAAYGTAGNFTPEYYERLGRENFKIYQWNIDSGDSRSLKVKADEIVANVLKAVETHPESVILFHDSATKKETAKALPAIIEGLRERDFEILPLRYETEIRSKGVVR